MSERDEASLPQLPDALRARLDAAGVFDTDSLRVALERDPELAQDYRTAVNELIEHNPRLMLAALFRAFVQLASPDQLTDFWRQVPTALEEPFLEFVHSQMQLEEDPDAAEAIQQRLAGLVAIRSQLRSPQHIEAITTFLRAESDAAARAIFVAERAVFEPYETQMLLDQAATQGDEIFRARATQRAALLRELRAADPQSLSLAEDPEQSMLLARFDALLRAIAVVAGGNTQERPELEALLGQLEAQGWQLLRAVQSIWAGERDMAMLTANLDVNSATLVRQILIFAEAPDVVASAAPLPVAAESPALTLPPELEQRLATAGVVDEGSLQAALVRDPALARDYMAIVDALVAENPQVLLPALFESFTQVDTPAQLEAFWQQVPSELQGPFQRFVQGQIAERQRGGQLEIAAALRQQLAVLEALIDQSKPLPVPPELEERLAAAGATDEASLQAALERDPVLAELWQQFALDQLLGSLLEVVDSDGLVLFWQQIPANLEQPFLSHGRRALAQAQAAGETERATALQQRIEALDELLSLWTEGGVK